MTPSEFGVLTRDKLDQLDRKAGRLGRKELAELERIGREAVVRERATRAAQGA